MAVKDDYQDFKNALNDLKMNNKSSINFLTILAEDKVHNASQIVRAIEERILESKGDYVLPALYVLDSIVKNLRSPSYIQLFENRLPVIFASAFNKVDERTRLAMFKLRQTWPQHFSNAVLHNLDTRTHYIDPAWPITARVPDASPSAAKIHFNPDFIQRNAASSTVSTNSPKSSVNSEEPNRPASQTTVKSSDVSAKDENYRMIPIDGKEQSRSETEPVAIKDSNEEQQSKIKGKNSQETSSEEIAHDKPVVKRTTSNEEEVLFGGTDIDYRDADVATQQKSTATNVPSLDTDHLFKLNSECLSLAEEKYKAKELSSEEYQATLKLLQNILQNEFQRLTVPTTSASSLINNSNHSTTTTLANTAATSTPNNPFQQSSLPFPPTTTSSLSTFPFAGFANDTHRHALQILSAAGATQPYASHYVPLPYIPPLPPVPAPPPFTLVPNTYPTPSSNSTTGRLSPSTKRPPDENSNNNLHSEQGHKRARRDSTSHTRSRNFDEENIAPVPSLLDANINTLKKKYLGVIQQLYIGKYQCRMCGLRFSAKQKHLYTHHLDWHYWENRQAAATSSAMLERCRDWYPSLQEWTVHEENLDEQIKNSKMMLTQNRQPKETDNKSSSSSETTSCSAKGNGDVEDDRCYVCYDPFENFFDDNREEWRLKDAMRVDGKTYHPICYQDVKYHETNENAPTLSAADPSTLTDLLADETSNQSSDSQVVDNAMATVNIKSENEETMDKDSLSSPEDSKPNYLSSMSFVNLIETIFVKKEDLKPIENLENGTINVKEELLDSTSMAEDAPFLPVKPETECEFLINPISDGIGTTSE